MDYIPKVNIWVNVYQIEAEKDEKMMAMDFVQFNQKANEYYKSKKLNVAFSIKKPENKTHFNYEITYSFT